MRFDVLSHCEVKLMDLLSLELAGSRLELWQIYILSIQVQVLLVQRVSEAPILLRQVEI